MSPISFSPHNFENTCGVKADDLYTLKYHSRAHLHYHDCTEIGLCVEGSGVCFIQQQAHPFVQGQVTFVRAGDAHIFQSPDQRPSRWFFFYVSDDIFKIYPFLLAVFFAIARPNNFSAFCRIS